MVVLCIGEKGDTLAEDGVVPHLREGAILGFVKWRPWHLCNELNTLNSSKKTTRQNKWKTSDTSPW